MLITFWFSFFHSGIVSGRSNPNYQFRRAQTFNTSFINKLKLQLIYPHLYNARIQHFSQFDLFPVSYSQMFFNKLKFGSQANITNWKVQFIDADNPLNRFKMVVVLNNNLLNISNFALLLKELFFESNWKFVQVYVLNFIFEYQF